MISASASSSGPDSRDERWLLWLIAGVLLLRLATLGAYPLMDNTEARYAEVARQMVVSGDWITLHHRQGEVFWSKPPLSTWLAALSYLALGVNAFAARLASFLPSLLTAWLVYDLARSRGRRDTAVQALAVLLTTPLFFIAAGAVMTDAALALGTTLSMAGFWYAMTRPDRRGRLWGYLFFIGLAIGLLAKGPVGVVLTLLPVGIWTLWKGGVGNAWRRLPWITGILLTIALAVPWYLAAESRTPGFLDYFIVGEHWNRYLVSGWKGDRFGTAHSRPRGTIWLFFVVMTLPWCAAWLGLARSLRRAPPPPRRADDDGWRAYLWLWMLASPVFFTPAGNILATYVLPSLPAFALLLADAWTAARDLGRARPSVKYLGLVVPALMIIGVAFVLPRVARTYSHEGIVAEYLQRRANADQELVYLGPPPLSAEFYAAGRIATVDSAAELERRAARGDFVVVTDRDLDAAPALRERTVALARSGRWQLLRDRGGTPAR